MKPKHFWLLVGLLMAIDVVACARVASPSPGPVVEGVVTLTSVAECADAPSALLIGAPISRTQRLQNESVAASPTVSGPPDPALQGLVVQAKEDMAKRLSIGVEQISLVEAEAVEWPNASLGCPEPGKAYAQVATPGYRIVLETLGESYEYHSDSEQRVICCEPRRAWPVLGAGSTDLIDLAKADLAQRLGVSVANISVAAVLRQEFSADAFYCRPAQGRIARDESPVVIVGKTILLSAAGRMYEYHATDQTVVFCRQLS